MVFVSCARHDDSHDYASWVLERIELSCDSALLTPEINSLS